MATQETFCDIALPEMRAKMRVSSVQVNEACDVVSFCAVCKSEPYGDDGFDEDNTFAKFSPSADLKITIANPALFGCFRPGQKFYLDFTKAD